MVKVLLLLLIYIYIIHVLFGYQMYQYCYPTSWYLIQMGFDFEHKTTVTRNLDFLTEDLFFVEIFII